MTNKIERLPESADPNCDVKVEFSNQSGTAGGEMSCPFLNKSYDPKNPRPECVIDFLNSQGYRVTVVKGSCLKEIKAAGSDSDSKKN